jgi:hypothetical protein
VTTIRPTGRWTTPSALLVLTLQLLAGGLEPLAHAREPDTAPIGIEAHHDASCVVIHDALRCALCQYAASRGVLRSPDGATTPTTVAGRRAWHPCVAATPSQDYLSPPPRAPPDISV